jgi:GDP-L-fucose synthase
MKSSRIYIAGHQGMVGSALCRMLEGKAELILASRQQLDLLNQAAVHDFFAQHEIDQVYLAAAKVGGIYANQNYPADFIYQNLMIASHVIHAAYEAGVKRLLYLGSSCIYPRLAQQPMNEMQLMQGSLEPSNEPYAIAKIAGIKLCESYNRQYGSSHGIDYRSVMPTNLYGPNDHYHPQDAHVIPALIRRFHEAKVSKAPQVVVWGTGQAQREFMYVDDLARACYQVMELDQARYAGLVTAMNSHLNIGSGEELSIAQLASMIAKIVGYQGEIVFDATQADGTPRKSLDSSKMKTLGWAPRVSLNEGLVLAYQDFLKGHHDN